VGLLRSKAGSRREQEHRCIVSKQCVVACIYLLIWISSQDKISSQYESPRFDRRVRPVEQRYGARASLRRGAGADAFWHDHGEERCFARRA